MPIDFAVQTHTRGRTVTLALNGELDLVSSPTLQRVIDDAVQSDAELLIVDLRGLEFMDSTGLHVLVKAQRQAHDAGRRFALVRGREQVQRLFDLTGVAEGFTVVDSPERLLEVDRTPGLP
ncbi:MAG: STAS domain-containing protein [Solirubrobacterales bacterium]|nr:STAS domain-containing protein [Solirubrobacterales bacterium]